MYYITPKELHEIGPMGINRARDVVRKVREAMEEAGCILPPRGKAPRSLVAERLGVKL